MTVEQTADARGMYRAHSLFRREFGLIPSLIRKVAERDTLRSEIVGGHIDLLCRILHAHHEAEDRLLWPLLLERCGNRAQNIVPIVRAQHESLDTSLETIKALLSPWRSTARGGFPLAMASTELNRALTEHMALEEDEILPLAEQFVTAAEWKLLADHGHARFSARELPLYFGMTMYGMDPESLRDALAAAPLTARVLVPRFATRAYARHCLRVHGTATPAPAACVGR